MPYDCKTRQSRFACTLRRIIIQFGDNLLHGTFIADDDGSDFLVGIAVLGSDGSRCRNGERPRKDQK